jgi:hypothetical protein
VGAAYYRSRHKRIARREGKRPICSDQSIKPISQRVGVGKRRRKDGQAELDQIGVAAELGLDQPWIDQLAPPQPADDDDAADDHGDSGDHQLEHERPVAA